ncbi:putative ribosome-binding factor A, mitochondrial isoform X2 [Nycticebus coucang]|uniref:putative ribosome-binding factor A, mitochondrial isoform X2 n=1 Tax=Nycticebus coucang TaxID=9470 RepID=UPI00234C4D84|nr:putative ribosome-binding factor A, mitochondrial isoform X2 [Nycticebus coucang]
MSGPAGGLWGLHAGLWALLRSLNAALLPGHVRALHVSSVSCGSKNLLKKFASKSKKKFWYDGPSLGSHLTYTPSPSKFEFLMKNTSKKARKEDQVRLRALNGLLHKALTDLLCTPEVSQEVCDLSVELSKVSLTSDFSACRVYWKTTLSTEQNSQTQATLQKSAARMRHLLMSQQTLKNMPPIVFVQDKENAAQAEIDQLLAIADFGPLDGDHFVQNDFRDPDAPPLCGTAEPAAQSSLYGINHEALNKKIAEYKKKKESRQWHAAGPGPVAELVKQMIKKKKKAKPRGDQDSSLRSYLAGGDDLDDAPGYECHPQDSEEWEAERGGSTDQGRCWGAREE